MKLAFTYTEHHSAGHEWERRDLYEWLTDVFEAPGVPVKRGTTGLIKEHVTTEFLNEGWAMEARLDQEANLRVTAMKDDVAFQLQTGNMSRAPYDLLKMQYLCTSGKINAAAIALPTVKAAKMMGDNIANAERVIRELQLFEKVVTVPVLVVAFD
ncbi:BglII/BstYI family type II restriction endonuclease [Mesorhizobium humile]|uniref:Restriction endonuclease n=1 Tax=Mesorhizobium humile TaxID=3072313 RepID=A0ABU4YD08_9HYPH|nr:MULTISPECIES: BglII/BstYI family type II restriction endonuclease [unclassified Mesorhizobium]MDX8458392.1 hypothetical protein [Mesorhizobium sp. VK2D]MDX8483804.1 hypothetical protein [Mesorhizobium sp. VK2B]